MEQICTMYKNKNELCTRIMFVWSFRNKNKTLIENYQRSKRKRNRKKKMLIIRGEKKEKNKVLGSSREKKWRSILSAQIMCGKLCMRWELGMFANFRKWCVYYRMFVISDVSQWYEMQNQYKLPIYAFMCTCFFHWLIITLRWMALIHVRSTYLHNTNRTIHFRCVWVSWVKIVCSTHCAHCLQESDKNKSNKTINWIKLRRIFFLLKS